jgi:hypothetical protein
MKMWGHSAIAEDFAAQDVRRQTVQPPFGPGLSRLVSVHEVEDLRQALARDDLPADFEAKLVALAEGSLIHRFVERGCRLFVALLRSARSGSFPQATPAECERLLRVVAYVRKDDDAVPDYKPGGFMDDQQEVRAAMTELHPLLKTFKAWRLQHEVPSMWHAPPRLNL